MHHSSGLPHMSGFGSVNYGFCSLSHSMLEKQEENCRPGAFSDVVLKCFAGRATQSTQTAKKHLTCQLVLPGSASALDTLFHSTDRIRAEFWDLGYGLEVSNFLQAGGMVAWT